MDKQLLGSLELNRIYQRDCIEGMAMIPDGSIDLILCDPPYGNMKGAQLDGWNNATTEWDTVLDTDLLFGHYERILRENGVVVLFSQEPYTSHLRRYNQRNLNFIYPMYWKKDHFANALIAKKAPVSYVEDISVFHKPYDSAGINPLRLYFKELYEWIGKSKRDLIKEVGQKVDHTFRFDSSQFKLCKPDTYNQLISDYKINTFPKFRDYEELVSLNSKTSKVFNLNGDNFKSNVLEYKKDYQGLHPTQKPVALFEDIIKTYTNEEDVVLDNCMGSGTTAVAAIRTGRNFIGFERKPEYVEIANKRLDNELEAR